MSNVHFGQIYSIPFKSNPLFTKFKTVCFQIDQKVDEPWPLTVITHEGKREKIFLKPGEMLLYESAKMPHGRQFPFKGEFYDNLFVHFMLKNFKFYHTGGPIPKEEVVSGAP